MYEDKDDDDNVKVFYGKEAFVRHYKALKETVKSDESYDMDVLAPLHIYLWPGGETQKGKVEEWTEAYFSAMELAGEGPAINNAAAAAAAAAPGIAAGGAATKKLDETENLFM